jgi:ABC-type branched-subunit amino acid transport system substrate-binding protein
MQRRHFMLAGAAGASWPHWAHAASRTVRIGQSASLSGTQAQYGKDVTLGLNAAFSAANRAEGAGGLNFELQALDDGGVKERVATNTRTLIEGGAQALVGFTSGIGAQDCLPQIQQAQVALIGTASGNMGIRVGAPRDCTAHVRAGYDIEYRQIISYVRSYGFKRVGFVYLQDTSKINLATLTAALDEAGLKEPMSIGVDRNAKDADEAAKKLLAAKLDCVVFTTNAAPALAIAKAMTNGGYAGMLFASSLAGQDLINGVPQIGRSMVMSLVVPRPTALGMGVVSQCARDLAAVDSTAKLGVTVLEGYIAGRVTVEAARQAAQRGSGDVSRGRILEALANLKLDLGGYRVAYEGGRSQGSRYVDLVIIDRFGRIAG